MPLCVCVLSIAGCPGAKKTEFLTSVLDALSTDMVHAVTDPASAGRYGAPPLLHLNTCGWTRGRMVIEDGLIDLI